MIPDEVFARLGTLPYMRLDQGRMFYDFIVANRLHIGLELGFFHGVSTAYLAGALQDLGSGNLITIDHGYGLSTRYSHLYKILVKVGETVTLHEEIGLMGNTGWSTGPHLLYETRVDGQPENPLNFIKVNPYDVQK